MCLAKKWEKWHTSRVITVFWILDYRLTRLHKLQQAHYHLHLLKILQIYEKLLDNWEKV
jgi:hypothetical protein